MNKRLPKSYEWQELIDNCAWEWNEQKKGMTILGKNGKSIFLPAFGFKSGNHILYIKIFGKYWSSTLSKVNRYEAWKISFGSVDILMAPKRRVDRMSVRLVSDAEQEDFVDLGLPSGLLWAEKNVEGYYTFDEAMKLFEDEVVDANGVKIASGTNDSELKGWSYTIPEGFEAEIKDGKVIVKEKVNEDERIKKIITDSVFYQYCAGAEYKDVLDYLDKLEKQKEQDSTQFEEGFKTGYKLGLEKKAEQEPVEWSEADDALLKEIVSFFKDGTVKLQHDLDLYAGFLENKFKSLSPQPKQESEPIEIKYDGKIYNV